MIYRIEKCKFFQHVLLSVLLFFFLYPSPGLSAKAPELTDLSIEELMDIEVTSVSKRPQKLSEAAVAVFVITGEDIRLPASWH